MEPGPTSLTVTGPFAGQIPTGEDNLCLRAMRHVGAEARVTLDKHLPPASGIALGFDRLVMLATGAPRIDDVMWTPVP